MSILIWIVFGALAGWVGSIIMGTDGHQGLIINIVVGIIGASLGGYIMHYLGEVGVSGFNLYSFIVAVMGAVVLLALLKLIRG
jgi:uncharacterized membrane protein YeaQ/YmgE (transglycosylase-associated protein family)